MIGESNGSFFHGSDGGGRVSFIPECPIFVKIKRPPETDLFIINMQLW